MICGPCSRFWTVDLQAQRPQPLPAVALWTGPTGNVNGLCQTSLDNWLDNADYDPELEPARVEWIDGSRVLTNES